MKTIVIAIGLLMGSTLATTAPAQAAALHLGKAEQARTVLVHDKHGPRSHARSHRRTRNNHYPGRYPRGEQFHHRDYGPQFAHPRFRRYFHPPHPYIRRHPYINRTCGYGYCGYGRPPVPFVTFGGRIVLH